jgi:hypothetical protein
VHRNEIISLLNEKRYSEILRSTQKPKEVFRILIGLSYDKSGVLSWRAIELIGILAGALSKKNPEVIRNLAQRLLWMMRDESGNNPWSAPEILGEIVRNDPDGFADIAPVIASFHDEEMLRPGVLRAVFRIGDLRPDLIPVNGDFIVPYIRNPDPLVRTYALLVAGAYRLKEIVTASGDLQNDRSTVTLYENGELFLKTVGEIAEKINRQLSEEES